MNKIIERLDKWGATHVWDNGKTLVNDYCIVSLDDEFEHTYEDMTENVLDIVRKNVDAVSEYDKTLECPSVADIKANITELCGRKRDKVTYCFGDGLPTVNARYMLDIIKNLKVDRIEYESPKRMVVFKGELGTALLLPVHPRHSMTEKGYRVW